MIILLLDLLFVFMVFSPGHVVFPNADRRFSTSSGTTFVPYENQPRTKPIFRLENSGNLRVAGSMDLQTNYQNDFVEHRMGSARSAPENFKSKQTENKVFIRRPMNEISQTKSDFRSYPDHRPPLAVEMPTFSSQFQIGSSSKSVSKCEEKLFFFAFRRNTRTFPLDEVNTALISKESTQVDFLDRHRRVKMKINEFTFRPCRKWTL